MLREEVFGLYYFSGEGGITYADAMEMSSEDRAWHMERLIRQKKKEADDIEKARGK